MVEEKVKETYDRQSVFLSIIFEFHRAKPLWRQK
jgi:hypothetical protein